MNQEILVSTLAVVTAVVSAIISLWQVFSKRKADDKFIKTLRTELEPSEKKKWMELISEIQLTALKRNQIHILQKETAIQGSENLEKYIARKEELEKLQKEITLILEKLDALNQEEKKVIIKSVNQPSEQGQIAYLDKLINEIGKTSALSPKE